MTRFGPYRFDPGNGLWHGEREVPLPPRAIAVLAALVGRPGVVVSKQALLDAAWKDACVTEASLLEAIRVLREALGDDRLAPTYIQTVHRRGYRFVAPVKNVEKGTGPFTVEDSRGTGPFSTDLRSPGVASTKLQSPSAEEPLPAVAEAIATRLADPFEWGPHWRPLVVAGASGVCAMVGIALVFAVFGQRPPDPRPPARFTIALPGDMAIDPFRGSVAVSADGSRMVYVAVQNGRPRLFLRTIDRDAPEAIAGSDGAADPFFSPDAQWVGFFAHGSLKKLRVEGGTAVVVCAARAGAGATWTADGTIVFGGGPGGGLARVSQEGGEPVVLAAPAAGSRDISYGWPDALPGGRHIVYTAVSLDSNRMAVLDLTSGLSTTLVENGAFGRYSPTGHLVFERRGRLEAAPFSAADHRLTDQPRPILRGLATGGADVSGPRFAFSRTGSLLYVPGVAGEVEPDERLHWLDTTGRLEPLALPAATVGSVDVAPDQQQLAMALESDRGPDLWVGDLQRGAVSRLTAEGSSVSPTWRPDGLAIAFAYSKAGPFNLFVRPADSDRAPEPLLESPWNQFPTSWSPDGRSLAFTEVHPVTGADVWVLDVATRSRRQVVRTLFDESHARYSPDGRWLAYMANESGRWDVFVRPATGDGPRVQVSTGGGGWPCWSVDGRTLYFSVNGQAAAAAVAVDTTGGLRVSAPLLIPGRDDVQLVSAHGGTANRLLVRQSSATPSRRELRVVLDWFTELARLVRLPA